MLTISGVMLWHNDLQFNRIPLWNVFLLLVYSWLWISSIPHLLFSSVVWGLHVSVWRSHCLWHPKDQSSPRDMAACPQTERNLLASLVSKSPWFCVKDSGWTLAPGNTSRSSCSVILMWFDILWIWAGSCQESVVLCLIWAVEYIQHVIHAQLELSGSILMLLTVKTDLWICVGTSELHLDFILWMIWIPDQQPDCHLGFSSLSLKPDQ